MHAISPVPVGLGFFASPRMGICRGECRLGKSVIGLQSFCPDSGFHRNGDFSGFCDFVWTTFVHQGLNELISKKEWVEIATVHGEIRANVIKSLLEDNSIPVVLRFRVGSSVYPFTVGNLSEVKVLVPKFFAEKAKELIEPEENVL